MIQFKQVTFARGNKVLVQEASFQLHPGHRVGLTGANGAGKSSLLALLQGEMQQESGDIEKPNHWVIAHVAQETPALADSALRFVLEGDAELTLIEQELTKLEQLGLQASEASATDIAKLHQRLQEIDGYSAKARAAALLDGLGFQSVDLERAVSEFSGGWRVRLNLARALMCRSDLLLLDEPTNHLDLETVVWLEDWIKRYRGTLLMISHDRDFLDNTVNHVMHIEHQALTLYKGGYSDFERQRGEKLALQQAMFEKQQRKVAHLQSYIDRFRVQATKARQAQSRIKALERMEKISAAHADSQFTFTFKAPLAAPDPLLVISQGSLGYGEQAVLKSVQLTIRPGERIGLLGKNGAGKSTLIKTLVDDLSLLAGDRVEGKYLNIGYFAQHQLEKLRLQESPLQHMQRLDNQTREQEHLDFLGGFDFRGEMARTPCENFSGGEKSRLALALLIWTRPNLLLLDEPTNHLDLEMRHALMVALQDYEGGLVLVSHDRALLSSCCDKLVRVDAGKVTAFDGDLEDYMHALVQEKQAEKQLDVESEQSPKNKMNSYAQQKADRQARLQERRPLVKKLAALESQLDSLSTQKGALDDQLQSSAIYEASQKELLQQVLMQQAETQRLLANVEEEWMAVQEALALIPEI